MKKVDWSLNKKVPDGLRQRTTTFEKTMTRVGPAGPGEKIRIRVR